MNKNESFFETSSLPLASTFVCHGVSLEGIDKHPGGKATFLFPKSSEVIEISQAFWQKNLRLEPNAYWEAIRFLKSRLYGE